MGDEMKKTIVLLIILLGNSVISFSQAQEEFPSVVYTALEHLNEYLIEPISLHGQGVAWDWEILGVDDFGDDCRERDDTSVALPTLVYDIYFYRETEAYHYRISMDEQLIVPCIQMLDAPDDIIPPLMDALYDLNRRVHFEFTLNDLPWRWQEVQFEDYTLGCPQLTPPEENFDQTINGYIIEFTLRGEIVEYRVSSDRLIIILCEDEDEE